MPDRDPLILTAALDPVTAALLQQLRDQHFPIRLNIVPAHLTLFHHLPGHEQPGIESTLRAACLTRGPIAMATRGLRFLGRGVAIDIAVPPLVALQRDLAALWSAWLTPQDRQAFRPHVTIQNKADPRAARALRDRLAETFVPMTGAIVGLDLWEYRGGPWAAAASFRFARAADDPADPLTA